MEEFGPVQILVIGFEDGQFSGVILEELRRLREHDWAIPLRDAIADAGGVTVADEWVHPRDLVAAGAALDAQAQSRAEPG